jgi:hypothetical protein
MRPGQGERYGRGGHDDEAGHGEDTRTEPVDVASGDEAGHEGADALRDERDAGAERGGAAHVLVKQRQQEHRAVREKPEKNRTALAEPTDRSSGLNTGVMRRDCEGAETRMRAKGLPRGGLDGWQVGSRICQGAAWVRLSLVVR